MINSSLEKARSRLRIAAKALGELETCPDYATFMDIWYTFLVAYKNVFTSLEQAVKGNAGHMQWFGRMNTRRRLDPLLQYLYQARSDDEHGLETGHELAPGHIAIGVAKPGETTSVSIDSIIISDGLMVVKGVNSLDGRPVRTEIRGPHARLTTVLDRGKNKYNPPTEHLGQRIADREPLTIAKLGFAYVSRMVEEASGLA